MSEKVLYKLPGTVQIHMMDAGGETQDYVGALKAYTKCFHFSTNFV